MWFWPFPSTETSLLTLNANLPIKIWAGLFLLEVYWHKRAMNWLWKRRLLLALFVKQFCGDIFQLDLWLPWRKSLGTTAVLCVLFQLSMWLYLVGKLILWDIFFSSLLSPFSFARFSVSVSWWHSSFCFGKVLLDVDFSYTQSWKSKVYAVLNKINTLVKEPRGASAAYALPSAWLGLFSMNWDSGWFFHVGVFLYVPGRGSSPNLGNKSRLGDNCVCMWRRCSSRWRTVLKHQLSLTTCVKPSKRWHGLKWNETIRIKCKVS